ncbi:fused MFS/spermidine synthase [Haloferula sp. A504]|uniref:fused MFS/spermidine synthase n=1 Tax=Haloferula sp. A504 TaxID=3373601 RepID=UPI0031CBEA3F|nr:fused MFS/spermidine synthase [Verrucomicrobiaceae bacterium E54]
MKRGATQQEKPKVPVNGPVLAVMVLVSGFAGLVYQVLWMKQLGLLFGNTAQAAAVTLAAFFAGLGAGSAWWGRRVGRSGRPLRLYAWLEFGIAVTALVYFGVLWIFYAVYPAIEGAVARGGAMLAVKFGLALLLVFPPAFFMGGTVPAMGQVAIRDPQRFGRTAAFLYATNTLGAALGVACAAFVWIPSLGYAATYGIAMILSTATGVVAWLLSREKQEPVDDGREVVGEPVPRSERLALVGLCFFSGFVVLALEVVWTRVFAQVHENSVYSYAIILIVVLVGLALGAGVSSIVARMVRSPWPALGVMTLTGGGLLVLGPTILMHVTNGLQPVQSIEAWGDYVGGLFKTGFRGVGLVVVVLGTVFPFLMKVAEREVRVPGRMLGRLLAINTAGAIAGALMGGFVMLPAWGMWGTLRALAAMYLGVALLLPLGWGKLGIGCRAAGVGLLVLAFTVLDPTGLPVMGAPSRLKPSKTLQVWESSGGTVAAVERPNGHRAILIDGGYSLGSTQAYIEQANQARIPLYLFPDTETICFIGLGTGMSAGAALDEEFPKVRRVVSCELTPAVVEAAKAWIPEQLTGGIFDDPRSEILIEDGRHYLMAAGERFDMINADLFLPYRRGAGSLYSLEHYEVVAQRLNPGGVFVQWLPLYQLTEDEFGTIVRTMLEAFGEVTMWRNNFEPGQEKVALIGRVESGPVPVPPPGKREEMRRAVAGLDWRGTTPDMLRVEPEAIPFMYAGNLTKASGLFGGYPLNTDDRPVIEYQAPKGFREVAQDDEVIWCVGPKFTAWVDRIFEASPLDEDPVWKGHPESNRHLVKAGVAFHRAMVAKALGDFEKTREAWQAFQREWATGAR